MIQLMHDTNFWGFMAAVIAAARWLIRVVFISRHKTNIEKAKLDSSVERLKTDNAIRLATILQATVDQMKPTIAEHSKILTGFQHSFDLMMSVEGEATHMMKELKIQYGNFTNEIQKFNSSNVDAILGRVKNIESEIKVLKEGSGNVFITTKK
jgi:hypothetical protein